MAFAKIAMEVSRRDKALGKFVKIGDVEIYCPVIPQDILPILSAAEIKKDESGKELEEDGLPVFTDDRANWIQSAIMSAVKAQARNKLESGTVNLKPNNKIATDWTELTAENQRGPGAANALLKEFKGAFADWIAKQGVSENAQNTLLTFIGNKAALSLQPNDKKDKVLARLNAFADSLSSDDMEKFLRPLESLQEACEHTAEATEDDL